MSISQEGTDRLGRNELLAWFNAFLTLNYQKIEETASGAAHCQIFDALYPGSVPLHRVNFNASAPYQYLPNYKLLQTVFNKLGIEKVIPVHALIEGKMQANLEFSQWIKGHFDRVYTGNPYDGPARRSQPKSGLSRTTSNSSLLQSSNSQRLVRPLKENSSGNIVLPTKTLHNEPEHKEFSELLVLKSKNADLRITINQVEVERDFYFNKLRDIEILTSTQSQDPNVQALMSQIQTILYATGEHLFAETQ